MDNITGLLKLKKLSLTLLSEEILIFWKDELNVTLLSCDFSTHCSLTYSYNAFLIYNFSYLDLPGAV